MRMGSIVIHAAVAASMVILGATAARAYDDEDLGPNLGRGEFSFHFGAFEPRADSDRWHDNDDLLLQDRADFVGLVQGLTFATHINPYLDFAVGGEYYKKTDHTSYVDFVFSDGSEIKQKEYLRLTPLDFTFRFLPIPRSESRGRRGVTVLRPVIPYLGGGVGALFWDYREVGNFIDDPNALIPTVSHRDRHTQSVTPSLHAVAGVEVQFSPNVAMQIEGKYRWARDELGSQFKRTGIEDNNFDLSGGSLSAGLAFRF